MRRLSHNRKEVVVKWQQHLLLAYLYRFGKIIHECEIGIVVNFSQMVRVPTYVRTSAFLWNFFYPVTSVSFSNVGIRSMLIFRWERPERVSTFEDIFNEDFFFLECLQFFKFWPNEIRFNDSKLLSEILNGNSLWNLHYVVVFSSFSIHL